MGKYQMNTRSHICVRIEQFYLNGHSGGKKDEIDRIGHVFVQSDLASTAVSISKSFKC